MYGQPVISQEWSVHAQLTISHHRPTDGAASDIPSTQPTTAVPPDHHDATGMHMEYSWGGHSTPPPPPPAPPHMTAPTSSSIPPGNCYGFQRGNILFTTRPPPREHYAPPNPSVATPSPVPGAGHNRLGTTHLLDSGYNSEQVSPGSYASLPTRRSAQPYSRRCKSTCSIVLSGAENQGISSASMRPTVDVSSSDCLRNSSMTASYPSDYKCGDPVCYHQTVPGFSTRQNRPKSSDFVPLPETCEVCGGGRSPTAIRRASGANTFTTHFCTRVPERTPKENKEMDTLMMTKMSRDAASQTSEHLTRTIETSALNRNKPIQPKMGHKVAYGGTRRKTDSELLQLPAINIPEPDNEVKKPTSGKHLSRSPAHRLSRSPARLRGQSPLLMKTVRKSQGSQCTLNHPLDTKGQHKPRTVHIDVYCTGSEDADASGSSDDSEASESWSSPQTVFESDKLKVVHARMGRDKLPVAFLRRQEQQHGKATNIASRRSESFKYEAAHSAEEKLHHVARGYDSDDGLSSHYPSQVSSYSTLRGATETSLLQSEVATTSSRNESLSTMSSSSIALSDEYDSAAATSWKDTTTDLESLLRSTQSLAQSESFEYADAADRLRIREKERAWADTESKGDGSKTWRSPHTERKHLLQQQKFKEFLDKHVGKASFPVWKPETTEDSDDDETGDAWSFCGQETQKTISNSPGTTLKREDTVKRVSLEKNKDEKTSNICKGVLTIKAPSFLKPSSHDTGSLSDSGPHRFIRRTAIGPFGYKLPSPPPSKVASSVTSPFTNIPGKRTDQLSKAEKFGAIVGAFRKPGHHVGPSKNPECACEHCQKYYESKGYRTRTRSVGDAPLDNVSSNWKIGVNASQSKRVSDGENIKYGGIDSDLENSSIAEDASTDNEKSVKHIYGEVDSDTEGIND